MSPVPAPEAIDPAWMTGVLDAAGVARGARVQSVHLEGDIGTGQSARSMRLTLTWDDPGDRPRSVVGKFPSEDPGARATLESTGGYWNEWFFYDTLAATVGVRAPVCHAARYDRDTGDFVILMEDLVDSAAGDQLEGLDVDEVSLAVDQAALMHAPRFGDPQLEALLGARPGTSTLAEAGPFCAEMYASVLPAFTERFESTVEPDALEFVARLGPSVASWFTGTGSPTTLVHQDLRADNLLFAETPDAPAVVVVDFQSLTAGVGATDVAYLLGGSLADPAERAEVERELLGRYRARMAEGGVDQSADDQWRDYRHGSLWGVIMTVLSSIAAARTDRGEALFAAMANRHVRHAMELDALGVLS